MSTVSFKEIHVNSDLTSKLAKMHVPKLRLRNSLANENESVTVYWLIVIGDSKGTRNLDSLKLNVPMADIICLCQRIT